MKTKKEKLKQNNLSSKKRKNELQIKKTVGCKSK